MRPSAAHSNRIHAAWGVPRERRLPVRKRVAIIWFSPCRTRSPTPSTATPTPSRNALDRRSPNAARRRCRPRCTASGSTRRSSRWPPSSRARHLQGLIEHGHVRRRRTMLAHARRARCWPGSGSTSNWCRPPRAARSGPRRCRSRSCSRTTHLMVIDKAAGMVVHPAAGNWSGTLLNALARASSRAAASLPRAGIVHRLDKDTSGLMVVGKTLPAVTALSRAIAAREVHRAVPRAGARRGAPGSLQHRRADRPRPAVARAHGGGRVGQAGAHRCASGRCRRRRGFSALRCTLHTGRTHQIRVHLASRGHPLVGDAVYGGRPALGMTRQALHATRLAFVHPVVGRGRCRSMRRRRPIWRAPGATLRLDAPDCAGRCSRQVGYNAANPSRCRPSRPHLAVPRPTVKPTGKRAAHRGCHRDRSNARSVAHPACREIALPTPTSRARSASRSPAPALNVRRVRAGRPGRGCRRSP